MHRSHHLLTMLALSACAAGGVSSAHDRAITVSPVGAPPLATTIEATGVGRVIRRSPGSRASKRRRNKRRRGW